MREVYFYYGTILIAVSFGVALAAIAVAVAFDKVAQALDDQALAERKPWGQRDDQAVACGAALQADKGGA